MTNDNQQLEKEVKELLFNGFAANSVNALDAACLILDNKFGKDFHKKNPKLAIRFADSIIRNISTSELSSTIQNLMGEYLDSIREAVHHKDFKVKEAMYEDYADLFRF